MFYIVFLCVLCSHPQVFEAALIWIEKNHNNNNDNDNENIIPENHATTTLASTTTLVSTVTPH